MTILQNHEALIAGENGEDPHERNAPQPGGRRQAPPPSPYRRMTSSS